jgi:hypothetical protein
LDQALGHAIFGQTVYRSPTSYKPNPKKTHYCLDSALSLYSLVGRTRFELVTNGLKVHKNQDLPVLNGVDIINVNQHLTRLLKLNTVDLHIGIFVEFAYRLPTDFRWRHEWTEKPGTFDRWPGG